MTQQLGDLLGSHKFSEPPEIKQIKDFVHEELGVSVRVALRQENIIVSVPSAAAAGVLRTKIFELQKRLETKKRIVIRIS